MKKVINRKLYDTEKADVITEHRHGYGFSETEETLYKTKSGTYFLHGVGGPLTPYRTPISDNSWSGGEDIIPFDSEDDVVEWLEEKEDASTIEKYFPDKITEA